MKAPTQEIDDTAPETKSGIFSLRVSEENERVVATTMCAPITNALMIKHNTKNIFNLKAGSDKR